MLNQFLVLGLIPGTNLQITFSDLWLLLDFALIYYLLSRHGYSFARLQDRFNYYRLYFSVWRNLQFNFPISQIGRIS